MPTGTHNYFDYGAGFDYFKNQGYNTASNPMAYNNQLSAFENPSVNFNNSTGTGNSFGGNISSGTNQPSWLSKNMGNIGMGLQAGAAVGQVVLGFENLEEQKKVNAMNMALAKKDLANRAQVINNALGNQTNSQAAGDERFAVSSAENPDAIAARRAEARAYAENKLNEQKVSGTV